MKDFIIKNIKTILIIVLFLAFCYSAKSCRDNKILGDSAVNSMSDSIEYYKTKLGQEVASKQVVTLERDDFKKLYVNGNKKLEELTKKFSEVRYVGIVDTKLKVDSIKVPFEVKIPCEFERKGSFADKYLKFNYDINQDGFGISDVESDNKQTFVLGEKRKWIFGKSTMTLDVTNSNEYLKTTNIKAIEIYYKKPFYDTRGFNIAVGAILGAAISRF